MKKRASFVEKNRAANRLAALVEAGLPRLEALSELPAEAEMPRGATGAVHSMSDLKLRFADDVAARLTAIAERHGVSLVRVLQAAAVLGAHAEN